MTADDVTTATLTDFAAAIDARDWELLDALLHPAFAAHYVHTHESFDRVQFVALNRDYPVVVRFEIEDLVVSGQRGVLRSRVDDVASSAVWFVASFATVSEDGLIEDLVEVWADLNEEAATASR